MQATFCLEEKLASVTSRRAIKSLAVKLSRGGGGAGLGLYHGFYRGATIIHFSIKHTNIQYLTLTNELSCTIFSLFT